MCIFVLKLLEGTAWARLEGQLEKSHSSAGATLPGVVQPHAIASHSTEAVMLWALQFITDFCNVVNCGYLTLLAQVNPLFDTVNLANPKVHFFPRWQWKVVVVIATR